ncbi:MAG: AAA family ATPase [Firmicutes bacterium]|nr:AAA family ATPase [Bacillota bacterium]
MITNLTAYIRKPLQPGRTLVFFDEVQECLAVRTAIKFLAEDGRFDCIQSGTMPQAVQIIHGRYRAALCRFNGKYPV